MEAKRLSELRKSLYSKLKSGERLTLAEKGLYDVMFTKIGEKNG